MFPPFFLLELTNWSVMKGRASWDWWSLEHTSPYRQEAGWSLVPKQVLSRCCTGPVISCKATCWQTSVWSSLRHDPSWDVPQHLIQLFSCVSTSVHPHPIQFQSLQRIVLVEPYAACLGSKAKQNKPALEGFITKNKAYPTYHSRASMACPPLFLYHSCNACTFAISFQTAQEGIK